MESLKVGIDLGTTYCAVAAIGADGRPFVVRNGDGNLTTPSVIAIDGGDVAVGDNAKDLQAIGSQQTAAFFKRHMGDKNFMAVLGGNVYDAPGLSALLLRKLIADAQVQLGKPIGGAVVTVPAYFRSREREAVYQACREAGIAIQGLLSEPSAAAYAYGLDKGGTGKVLLVYDLGGGTFDVTVARVGDDEIRVLGCDGDHRLGGKDFDDALVGLLLEKLCMKRGINLDYLELDEREITALSVQAEQVKRQLTSRGTVTVPLRAGGFADSVSVSRVEFEQCTAHLVAQTLDVAKRLLCELGLSWSDIDAVVPVGGSTRMPMVLRALEEASGQAPCGGVNPDEAVALGAAIRANLPQRCVLTASGAAELSADEPVLTLQGAKRLVDVTAHAMGMVAESPDRSRYINSQIIAKNTPIPAASARTYALRVPATGGELEVYVLQGSADNVLDNDVCGKYLVTGIVPEVEGESLVEVEYRYNADAIIEVQARQPRLGIPLVVTRSAVESDLSRFTQAPPVLATVGNGVPDDIYLLFDVSGSMDGRPLKEAKKAMTSFVDELGAAGEGRPRVGIVLFSDRNKVILSPTKNYRKVHDAIASVEVRGGEQLRLGYGNAAEPLGFCYQELGMGGLLEDRDQSASSIVSGFAKLARNALSKISERSVCLVVLTDGCWSYQTNEKRNAQKLAEMGIDIVAVGFGGADREFLKAIATCDDYATLVGMDSLQETFTKIGRALARGEEPRVA